MSGLKKSSCQRKGPCPALAGVLLASLLLLATLADAYPLPRLTLTDSDGQILYACVLNNGASFAIRYTHSVAQTPVTDYFIIKNNEIWLDRTVYQDFGAGLPHTTNKGQTLAQRHGQLMLNGYNQRMPSFTLRVGRVAGHTLILFKQTPHGSQEQIEAQIPLSELAPPGSGITFSIEQPGS